MIGNAAGGVGNSHESGRLIEVRQLHSLINRDVIEEGRGMIEPSVLSTLVRSSDAFWQPMKLPGISIKVLRDDKESGEATALLKFLAGARFPAHNHPAGEQVFVLEGDLTIGRDHLQPGDYYYTPPNGKHAASSENGCTFLVILPKPIEIIK